MLSPLLPYSLVKMHWTPEHAQPLSQWPEQHLDVSSTTSSPAHKSELYHSRQRYNYAWANDDISALTASNLLKRYAEKYTGVLDSPYDRPSVNYPDAAFGSLNGQKSETEPWQLPHATDTSYPVAPLHDGLPGSKPGGASVVPPGAGSTSNLSDVSYTVSSCNGPSTPAGLGGVPSSQDYTSAYNGTYLSTGYCPQPSTALPPSHPPGLLAPAPPAPSLVSTYNSAGSMYNYPSGGYPPQASYAGVHPSAPYLPSGIAAPTPLPPSSRPALVSSYGYQAHGLPIPVVPETGTSLKRKAFEMAAEEDEGVRYRKYSYEQPKTTSGSPYHLSDKGECRGGSSTSFVAAGSEGNPQVTYKSGKPAMVDEHGTKYGSQPMKALLSPSYSGPAETPLRPDFSPPMINGENGNSNDRSHTFSHRMTLKATTSEELAELVSSEMIDRGPPIQWGDIPGQATVKAAIEEELLWPVLRPGAYTGVSRPPKTILLFGPRGGGKTLLGRCISTQLGATFFRVSGAALLSKWKAEGDKILQTIFLMAGSRQPAVVFINEVESVLSNDEKMGLLSYLETAHTGSSTVIVIGATRRPDLLDESALRPFAKRLYVPLPDSGVRQQILHHALAQQNCCLSERDIGSILQRTEGYSGIELVQLCQQAAAAAAEQLQPTSYKDFEGALCKVRPGVSQKELDLCMEWNKIYTSPGQ
ncbi:fidgetin-like protein 2 isoform X1 [Erpetoichthys calabaricus]|uniref:fidgetin-like protein 2 isoform X1 n=2 Tax=Erpetoichthys calabaricus TaxID=27687 RepID=UPI002234E330|nr:fidgetin-like protein 2 isoform X1 [Erpetoichthys calabaricus]